MKMRVLERLPHLWADVHPTHAGYVPNLVGLAAWLALALIAIGALGFVAVTILG